MLVTQNFQLENNIHGATNLRIMLSLRDRTAPITSEFGPEVNYSVEEATSYVWYVSTQAFVNES